MIVKRTHEKLDAHYVHWLASARGELNTRSEVVMVMPRPGRSVLAMTKSFYPGGIYNLPSGGVHPGESPEQAFAREVAEETSLDVVLDQIIARLDRHCYFDNDSVDFTSYIILVSESTQAPHPSDQDENISAYRDLTAGELREMARQMRSLTGRWLGFGRFRATTMDFVADWLVNLPGVPR